MDIDRNLPKQPFSTSYGRITLKSCLRDYFHLLTLPLPSLLVPSARSKFWGVEESEDFASATLPTTPLNFQGKIKDFCHPTLLKIRFKIIVTPPPPKKKKGQNQNYGASINTDGLLTLSGLLSFHFFKLFHQAGEPL